MARQTQICSCGAPIETRRVQAGYRTCPACGERAAQQEIKAKSKRIGQPFNKSGYMYLGSTEAAQREAARTGRKNT